MCTFLSKPDKFRIESNVIELAKREWAIKGTLDLRMERTAMVTCDGTIPCDPRGLQHETSALLPSKSLRDIEGLIDAIILHARESEQELSSSEQSSDGMLIHCSPAYGHSLWIFGLEQFPPLSLKKKKKKKKEEEGKRQGFCFHLILV